MEISSYQEEVKTAYEAAVSAGKKIDKYHREGFDKERKDNGSLVTEADKNSQKIIKNKIQESFNEDGFLGEESNLYTGNSDRIWVIDPLDGTFNFDKGFKQFCISIALKVEGEVVLGIVYSPDTSNSNSYFAVKNQGSYKINENLENLTRISISSKKEFKEATFFLTTFDIYEDEIEKETNLLTELASRGGVQRQLGSCAIEMCKVASGQVDMQINPLSEEWDYSAGKIIIEEAGGQVEISKSVFDSKKQIISSNGFLQHDLKEIVGERFLR